MSDLFVYFYFFPVIFSHTNAIKNDNIITVHKAK